MAAKQFKKAEKPKVAADKQTILRVELYNHFGKRILRPYVDKFCPIFVPREIESEKKSLAANKVFEQLGPDTSELCRRPQKGLSMTSAGEFLRDNADDVAETLRLPD